MTRTLLTILFTGLTATAAFADPGHLAEAGHGHSHWLGYGILVFVSAGIGMTLLAKKVKAPKRSLHACRRLNP